MKKLLFVYVCSLFVITACKHKVDVNAKMNGIAETYVKTVLEIGQYDDLYIDAYYGPKEWQRDVAAKKQKKIPSDILIQRIDSLKNVLELLPMKKQEDMLNLRKIFLEKQLASVRAHVEMLSGKVYSFDEESSLLYDAVVPQYNEEYFTKIIEELEQLVQGKGNLVKRLNDFQNEFIIPSEKLDTVFKAAIAESRHRTLKYIDLPENENFEIEYVTDKPWAAYNWYKGNNFSLIEVNIDYSVRIDRAIDLASHEGYPGHHVYCSLLESNMVKKRGWMEFSVYPLYSPQSLIAEGTANFGINVVFPKTERIKFEKETLFPLAGLNADKIEQYYKIQELVQKLTYARTTAMRYYLDGKWTREQTVKWMEKYALMPAEKVAFGFVETYRSYIINYNLGQDMVKNYVEAKGGTADQPQKRWEVFTHLISTPQSPSLLRSE